MIYPASSATVGGFVGFDAADACTEGGKLADDILVAALDEVRVFDERDAVGAHGGDDHRGACAQVAGMAILPSTLLGILPVGCLLYMHGTLAADTFLTVIVLSFGVITASANIPYPPAVPHPHISDGRNAL